MFQTFSGSSRRPRQVNLSGQNANPFAANPGPSGSQQTLANAQQERQQRHQERQRLNASKQIQRIWRGHRARRELAESRRRLWGEIALKNDGLAPCGSTLAEQSRLLLAFFSSRQREDIERLTILSGQISILGYTTLLDREDIRPQSLQLAKVTLEALKVSLPECPIVIFRFLLAIIDHSPEVFPRICQAYYSFLSTLLVDRGYAGIGTGLVWSAITDPLTEHIELEQNYEILISAYGAFALQFLTTANLENLLGQLDELATVVDVGLLSTALIRELSSSSVDHAQSNSRLWLLAHFIALHRLQRRSSQEPEFLRALSLQLSNSAGDIVGRIDLAETETLPNSTDGDDAMTYAVSPLPPFVRDELSSLVNQESITGLLAKFNIDYANGSAKGKDDASMLASYALTLVRIFPRRADEIRMWLYLGSMTNSGLEVPTWRFFWQVMKVTNTFSVIAVDSTAALTLLRLQTRRQSGPANNFERDREWRTILLFLELYTFVLKFTDDEEFLSGSNSELDLADGAGSGISENALPLNDVKQLITFLKNLAFTTYYNAGELSDDNDQMMQSGLGTYFSTNTSSSRFQSHTNLVVTKRAAARPFAGIAGMTLDYVKTIVTGVMRMLYERDSRRMFLPKDFWLMTSRFDMEGFIPAVVMEEERQHKVREADEDDVDGEDDEEFTPRDGLIGMNRPRRALQIESLRKQQQKTARKKVLEAVGPRLEVLQNMPFVIPFATRVQIFRQFVFLDQSRRRGGEVDSDIWRMHVVQHAMFQGQSGRDLLARHHARIRRDQIFEDAFDQFYELGEGLKEPIQITFVDTFDTVEAGIDGGGVTKEFLTSVTNEAFRAEDGPNLFISNDQNLLYPNPAALDEREELLRQAGLRESSSEWQANITDLLRQYEFLGRIVGKCLYEGILVDIGFAGFFLLKWAASAGGSGSGYRLSINDLRDLDEGLYQGLLKLKTYPGNVEDMSLDFTITDTISLPGAPTQMITRELMPNGSNITVTNQNRPLYVYYVARHRLQMQPRRQTQAFLKGLGEIINLSWLSMFNQSELQTLVGGESSEINVEDLRRNTSYGGIYEIGDDGQEHPTIQLFWKVMKELDDSDRRTVLKYVTSTPRAPLLGFSQLKPRFSIRDAGSDEKRLPSTSTCVNLLKLPRYSTASTLRQKLLYAVNSGAGFDLS